MAYVIIVEFRAKPGRLAAFAELVDRDAHHSRTLEDGCRAFDVRHDPDDPARFVFCAGELHSGRRAPLRLVTGSNRNRDAHCQLGGAYALRQSPRKFRLANVGNKKDSHPR
jgi:Antibiotic biosynthesis monooxygenase